METKVMERKTVYKGKIFEVVQDTLLFPNGKKAQWDLVLHNGAAAIVPLTKNNEIILVKQYRNAKDGQTLEIPAGKLEKGENPDACAERELEEEIGYRAGKMEKICEMYSAIGFSDEKLHLYKATDLQKGEQNLDEDEYIEIETYALEDAVKMIFDGRIQDSKTIVGILAIAATLK